MKKAFFALLYVAFFGSLIFFSLGFANTLHPLFDSLSNFRVHLLVILLILSFVLALLHLGGYKYLHIAVFVLGAIYLYILTLPFYAKPLVKKNKNSFTHMQFNINFRNKHMDKFKSYIKKNHPDIITLQEVTGFHAESLLELKTEGTYPYQLFCPFRAAGGGAILSKHPIDYDKTMCVKGQGLLVTNISINKKPISVATLHLYWPYPFSQQKQIQTLKDTLATIPKPALISGDFNAVAWSDAVSKVARYSGTKVVGGLRWSIELKTQLPLLPFMKLSIDHLLLSDELKVENIEVKEKLGSDHLPIVAKIWY